ncbi:60s acidic ribosomal protein-domain-containing protein [Geranomyces variabilis]|nr:60s acidic ribosomal protein-domain-containing protein [Geranomyces variabilis]
MKLLAAYMLATLGGNTSPSAADVKKILSSVGVEAEEERLTKLISELNGKDINELIAEGSKKLASMPAGGAAAGGAAPAAGGVAAAAPKEEKKEEVKEESDDDMDAFGMCLAGSTTARFQTACADLSFLSLQVSSTKRLVSPDCLHSNNMMNLRLLRLHSDC